jgi:hypothetical protein
MNPIRILFLAANPSETTRLQTNRERRQIEVEILKAPHRDAIQLVYEPYIQPRILLELLRNHAPQVVHFSGHGSQEHEVILEDDDGLSRPVGSSALEELFRLQGASVRVVVLNACYSQGQARALIRHVPCAIGMDGAIPDTVAVSFAAAFYQGLVRGESIRRAFDSSLLQLRLENKPVRDGFRRDLEPAVTADGGRGLPIPELLESESGIADRTFLAVRPGHASPIPAAPDAGQDDSPEARSIPALRDAVSLLFGDGHQVVRESRERRGDPEPAASLPAGAADSGPLVSEEACLAERVSISRFKASEATLKHLVQIMGIQIKSYRLLQKQSALWGPGLTPPIVVHSLEDAEQTVSQSHHRLHAALSAVFGKSIIMG